MTCPVCARARPAGSHLENWRAATVPSKVDAAQRDDKDSWRVSEKRRTSRRHQRRTLDAMACCVANYWGATTPSTTARHLAGIAPTLAPPAHSAARVSPTIAPSAQTSSKPSTYPPPSTSPSAPAIDTPDVFRDVTREPELLIAAVGSIARREGGWTVQADLKLIMHYWRYLLDPVRHSVNRLVICEDEPRSAQGRSKSRSPPPP